MLKEKIFNTGSVKINYAEGPASGPPLVLLHGIISRWQYFLPMIPSLLARWRIFSLDFRGHGKSGRVKGKYQIENYTQSIIAFLQKKITEPTILLGHSLGGAVALITANKLPGAVKAIIIGDTPLCVKSLKESIDPGLFIAWKDLASSGHSVEEIAIKLAEIPIVLSGQSSQVRLGDLSGMDAAFLKFEPKSLTQLDSEVLTPIILKSLPV